MAVACPHVRSAAQCANSATEPPCPRAVFDTLNVMGEPRTREGTVREVVCRGCEVTFFSHIAAVYCSDDCSFLARCLIATGECMFCHRKADQRPLLMLTLGMRNEYDRISHEFAREHAKCLRNHLEAEGRAPACRCRRCRRELERDRSGDTRPIKTTRSLSRDGSRARKGGYQRHRDVVLERDEYLCSICGLPLDPNVDHLDDQYATLDHIIRVSEGGGDEPDNLRAAHRWCNLARERDLSTDEEIREVAISKFQLPLEDDSG